MMKYRRSSGRRKKEGNCSFPGAVLRGVLFMGAAGLALLLCGALAAFRTADPERFARPLALVALYAGAAVGGIGAMMSLRESVGEVSGFLAAVCAGAAGSCLLACVSAVCGEGGDPLWLSLLAHLGVPAGAAFGAFCARPHVRRRR